MSDEIPMLPERVAQGIEKYVRSQIDAHINTKNESGNYKIQVQNINDSDNYGFIVIIGRVRDGAPIE